MKSMKYLASAALALLMSANAYAADPQPTDPVTHEQLLTVLKAVTGFSDSEIESLKKGTTSSTNKPLKKWIEENKREFFSIGRRKIKVTNQDNSGATGNYAMAVGISAQAAGEWSVAVGSEVSTPRARGVAVGNNVEAGYQGVGVGNFIDASGYYSVAIGGGAKAPAERTIAIGVAAKAKAANSTALMEDSEATAEQAMALGYHSNATAKKAIALGSWVKARGENSVALGYGAMSTAEGGVALGTRAQATRAKGVAGFDPLTEKASTETSVAWQSGLAAVSIGHPTMSRQLTGLAAGSEDNDAVNVAQLKALAKKAQADLAAVTGMSPEDVAALTGAGATGAQKPKTLAEQLKDKADVSAAPKGQVAKGDAGAVSGGTVFDAIESLKKELAAENNTGKPGTLADGKGNSTSVQPGAIIVGKDGKDGKDGANGTTITNEGVVVKGKDGKDGSASYGRDGLTISGPAGADGEPGKTIVINHDKADLGGNRLQNVADGVDPTDAVNKGQLDALRDELSAGGADGLAAVKGLEEKSNRGDAMGAALAALKPVDFNPLKPNQFMAAYGNVAGYSALALGLGSYSDDGDTFVHAGLAYGGKSNLSFNAGVSIQFGEDLQYKALKGTKVVDTATSTGAGQLKAMTDKLAQQDQTIATQNERLASQEATIAAQGQKIEALEKQLQQLLDQKK